MPANKSVPTTWGWVITDAGRDALDQVETCNCRPRVAGAFIECEECGTVYGTLREAFASGRAPREKTRWD